MNDDDARNALYSGAILHYAPRFYEAICIMWVNTMGSSAVILSRAIEFL